MTGEAPMPFDVGFDTVGNATVIVHDGAPVLATDR